MAWKLRVTVNEFLRDACSGFCFELGATGIQDLGEGIAAWFAEDANMEQVQQHLNIWLHSQRELEATRRLVWECSLEHIEDEDWSANWKRHWKQEFYGKRLSVCPSWIDPQQDEDRIILQIDPGMAFGTGTHETTRLLLEWLDELGDLKGQNVLDAGCGTGILAIAALKLGAAFALGYDNDPDAIRVARENAEVNDCQIASHFKTGDPASATDGATFDLVLANIQRSVIVDFFPSLLRSVAAEQPLLVSGILAEEEDIMRKLAKDFQLPDPDVRRDGEWIALCYRKPSGLEI